MNFPQKVLIAPLDWGLGHTTRCISIIRYLQQKSCQIFIAANKQQTILLQQELHNITFLSLEGYNISYPKEGRNFALNIALQVPGLLLSIHRENRWLKQKQVEFDFDLIISDNRYGMFHSKIFSIIITHQLGIRSGISKKTDHFINRWNHKWIEKFDQCWVPDVNQIFTLAGELSHPATIPGNVKFIGPLSRFDAGAKNEADYILVVISGPEPQRSIFEHLILNQVKSLNEKVIIIRGLPGESPKPDTDGSVEMHNHLPTAEFETLLKNARTIICRAGYSSIMDLILLGKRAILVPTPGQTEQEYLAEHLHTNHFFYTISQSEFNLEKNIEEARHFPFQQLDISFDGFKKAIDDLFVSQRL